MYENLSEKRKADRAKMENHVIALAKSCGARVTGFAPQGVYHSLAIEGAQGLCVTIDFDGKSAQPDIHCLAWHIATNSTSKLSAAFGIAQGYSVNTSHRKKCTAFARGFAELLRKIEIALRMATDGTAFTGEK